MIRISLRQLLLTVAFVALALVSFRYASDFWQGVVGIFAMLVALAAMGAGIFARGTGRAFAAGCAVAMLSYGLLVVNGREGPNGLGSVGNMESNVTSAYPHLPTTILLRFAYRRFPSPPPSQNFTAVGHYWFALLFGYVCGSFARAAWLRGEREHPAAPEV
jgi:hypothetical protein